MPDSELLRALNDALERDPDNVALRLHVASILLTSGAEAAALDHFIQVLSRDPANVLALRGAAQAADAVGDSARAASFRSLLRGLQGDPGPGPTAARPAPQPTSADEPAREPNEPLAVPTAGDERDAWWDIETSSITLADVGGMEDIKRRLHVSFLGPLRNPEVMKAYGKSLRGGLLLWGPPGCGKTYIARAVAGEMSAKFIALGLSDVLDMWLGSSESRLHALFQTARRNQPCVVFFDELDALGQKRSQLRGYGAMRNVVNQLLSELDGIGSDNEGVFVMGATNHPWDVDSALVRPGRFDRSALVLPPDRDARLAILESNTVGRPLEGVDLGRLADETDLFSGADVRFLVENAIESALEESLATGKVRPVRGADFAKALKQVKPSTREWFETARNYAMFSNEGGTYDDLLDYMKKRRML